MPATIEKFIPEYKTLIKNKHKNVVEKLGISWEKMRHVIRDRRTASKVTNL